MIYDMGVRPNEKISFSVNAVANTPAVSSNPADMNLEGQNAIIEKLANTWLRSYAPTFLDSESSNINEHTRNTSATQSYTQPSSAYVTNQVLIDHSYKAVNVI
ncbi:MAG: hypothetical protein H8E12_05475 [Rhodobacteraceae bacterium]|nr:hypothetical protein [Paracoccaceae bacterium]